jgi:broad specificity phosphatase PhoE
MVLPTVRNVVLALALLLAGAAPLTAQDDPVIVYLVRHAERADDGAPASAMMTDDPPLSEAGRERAGELALLLGSVGLTHVYSTDYARTRATALPTSEAAGLPIELYDSEELEGFARRLLATPGTHLVVGHSDTTPELVRALGGDPGEPIARFEYDRIYVVFVLPGGAAGTSLFRYGSPYARAR